jgi:hypothetical protein
MIQQPRVRTQTCGDRRFDKTASTLWNNLPSETRNEQSLEFFKGILSTTIVIFSYPKILSFSVLTFIKWRLTPSYAAKDTILWQKRPKTIIIGIIVQDKKEFKSIHITFYVNPSWACALFRNNKQHVVIGQKRKCQRVEESGLWRIQRERWIEVKYLPNGTNAGHM